MPPRIPIFQCLRVQNGLQSPTLTRPFSSTISHQASKADTKRRHRDPYAIAQAKARKTANLSRQAVLKEERAVALGDPVRGQTTPFVESFDTGLAPETSSGSGAASTETSSHLNFFVSKDELDAALERSKRFTAPPPEESASSEGLDSGPDLTPEDALVNQRVRDLVGSHYYDRDGRGGATSSADYFNQPLSQEHKEELARQRVQKLQSKQDTAEEALRRISSLSLGSSKDRLRLNKQRIIDAFGRHNTDAVLPPRPGGVVTTDAPEKTPRVGPDTGSSEVQIGILTAKIRTLADYLQTRGRMDKVNKRNLRLLVHRRAKLLNYLRKKERGGPRWQNLIETLGLTEGTWKGEITL